MIITAIIPAGGTSSRFIDSNRNGPAPQSKLDAIIGTKTVLEYSIQAFIDHPDINTIIVPCPSSKKNTYQELLAGLSDNIILTDGGQTRAESVYNAFQLIPDYCTHVLIHDAARPNPSQQLINRIIDALNHQPVVIPGLQITDTVKKVSPDNYIEETVDRSNLVTVQTPQGFDVTQLKNAYQYTSDISMFTDEASLLEANNIRGIIVDGDPHNIKITLANDLAMVNYFKTSLELS